MRDWYPSAMFHLEVRMCGFILMVVHSNRSVNVNSKAAADSSESGSMSGRIPKST